MRVSFLLLRQRVPPQNEAAVPFVPDMPMKLRNRVTGKTNRVKEKGCLHEFTVVSTCLEKNNYENLKCIKEAENFQNCYKTYLANKNFAKIEATKGTLVPGAKNLKYNQINKLLAMYPQS